jgi:hypothetical protein
MLWVFYAVSCRVKKMSKAKDQILAVGYEIDFSALQDVLEKYLPEKVKK